ncbi:hypothetical protein C8259_09045 [Nocardia nova]|uniref:HNH domain-containing protein n=1 Tax=Nocardia nova TaxID=37330 RepID=A0A2T2Z8B1_9NOCA|nr:hypothetical protein C8259_09045 [Nocardia nova]
MARARLHTCSVTGCPRLQPGPRCAEHETERGRHLRRTTPTKATRDYREQQRRAAAVRAHRARRGDWCPGWRRPPHPSADLTADHITPVASGRPDGPLQVLCRSCNSRKRDH